VHQKLASNAYAFSIDDAVSFKSLPGDGIVITIAGAQGLDNKTQTPLPTARTYHDYCRNGGTQHLQAPTPLPPLAELLPGRGVRVRLAGHHGWGIGEVEAVSGTKVTVAFPDHGIVVVDTRHHNLSVVRSGM
jgi:hypothetical protein